MKRFGFGAMRLPMVNGEVDKEQFNAMIDEFLAAGFTYFDTAHGYLVHAMSGERYDLYRDCGAFEIIPQLKREGRVRHFGMSFHDKAEVLDRILTEQPELEFVQLQFNYLDYEDPVVESRKWAARWRSCPRTPARYSTRWAAGATRATRCALPRALRTSTWCSPA